MTSKEALDNLRNFFGKSPYQKELNIIKQDLERLEEIKNLRTTPNALETSLANYMNKCIDLEKENEKLKKTIEIVNDFIGLTKNNNDYYLYACGRDTILTKEQYELVKEVLENE